jgi:hypothetical protein
MTLRRSKRTLRALIYARGTDPEIEEQTAESYALCNRHRYEVVSIVRDPPDGTQGYHDAHRMLRHDEAGIIISGVTGRRVAQITCPLRGLTSLNMSIRADGRLHPHLSACRIAQCINHRGCVGVRVSDA